MLYVNKHVLYLLLYNVHIEVPKELEQVDRYQVLNEENEYMLQSKILQ